MKTDENNRIALSTVFVRLWLHDLLLAASIRPVIGVTLLFGAAVALSAGLRTTSNAQTALGILYVVDSTDDGDQVGPSTICDDGTGSCTLRAAIEASNLHPGTDGISFNIPRTHSGVWTINPSKALPEISDSVYINGPGANALIVNGNQNFQLFKVTTTGTVNLSGLTMANGLDPTFNDPNATGIQNLNSGTVNVTNCTLSGNFGNVVGGGVYNGGTMNIANCTLSGNYAGLGGGVYNGGTMSITNCTFSDNGASDPGGGIYNSGTMSITNCTLGRNYAYSGGAITNIGTLLVTGSTINGNFSGYESGESGGGIENNGGTLTVTNSTISGNQTYGFGGGIFNNARNTGGTVTINCSTITNNSAIILDSGQGSDGGGIYTTPNTGSRVELKSSIIALNTATYGRDLSNDGVIDGSFLSHSFNLIGTNDGAETYFPAGNPNANNDIVGTSSSPVDPKFALDVNNAPALKDNGGPTQTIALLPGSPAIDKGSSTTAAGVHLTVDQRGVGYARTINKSVANATGGDGTDIGAFELGAQIKAVSRKTHGTAGMFDINLPLFGPVLGVECRKGGTSGVFKVILTFPVAVTVSTATVSPDPAAPGATGSVSSFVVNGRVVTVNLTGVSDAQTIILTLFGVSDGTNQNDVSVPMGVLFGDTNKSRTVNSSDVTLTQSKVGQVLSATNFREDVDINGSINSTDVSLVQSKVGTKLP